MTVEKVDTIYDLDSINSAIERMVVLVRQLSGVSRFGESGRSVSLELQWMNAIDERKYQVEELRRSVQFLFGQFRKIYLVNKDLYAQLNKRGGRIFELEKQLEQPGESKCLYYLADAIKYEPALLAMQRVLDRTMREIRIFRKQRNQHKLELCVAHIRNENYDKVYDEFGSFENGVEQLPTVVTEVFAGDMRNLMKVLLFLNGYRRLNKPNSMATFTVGCEFLVQHLQAIGQFEKPQCVVIYGFVSDMLADFVDHVVSDVVFRERLECLLVELTNTVQVAIRMIQTDPRQTLPFARLFHHLSHEMLIDLIRRSYASDVRNLKNILQFVSYLSCTDHDIICYRELYEQMEHHGHTGGPEIFMLAYHIKQTMVASSFPMAELKSELEQLKRRLSPVVVAILWKTVTISRHESRILLKFSATGKEVTFSRYTADKNRFELEPIDEGQTFRIRNPATNGYLGVINNRPLVVSKADSTGDRCRWRLLPCADDCAHFRLQSVIRNLVLYSEFSDQSDYDFYQAQEMLRLAECDSKLADNCCYWKIAEFSRGNSRGDSDCCIL